VPSIFLRAVGKVVRPAIKESVRLEGICRSEIESDVIRARRSGIRGRGKGKAWSGSIGLNWGGALEFLGWDQEFDMAGCGI